MEEAQIEGFKREIKEGADFRMTETEVLLSK